MVKRIAALLATSGMFAVFLLPPAHLKVDPYIDAGTTSIIIQAVIGGLAAGLITLRIFWNRVKAFFKGLFSRGKKGEDAKEQ